MNQYFQIQVQSIGLFKLIPRETGELQNILFITYSIVPLLHCNNLVIQHMGRFPWDESKDKKIKNKNEASSNKKKPLPQKLCAVLLSTA